MVKNPRTETRPGPIRSLNSLKPVQVAEGSDDIPTLVCLRPRLKVEAIEDRWRIDDEWWRGEEISRMYFKVLMEDGREGTIFRDLVKRGWYLQAYD